MTEHVPFRLLRITLCLGLALMLSACLGSRSVSDGGWWPFSRDAQETRGMGELDIDSEMNSAWAHPDELVDEAFANPDMCVGDCLTGAMDDDGQGFLPWEEPDLDQPALKPEHPKASANKRDARRSDASAGTGQMIAAAMPSGKIPRPAHEKAAMCNGSQSICISSPFGVNRPGHLHKGVDIRAPFGSPIKAFRSGIVADARWHHSYGKVVDIRQDDGLVARYAHMSQILVHAGDRVWQGQTIGRVGSTGRSTGPHLHFELIKGSQHMNPMVQLHAPAHVVSHATENDALQARQAMAAGGRLSAQGGKDRHRSRVINRHAPVKASRLAVSGSSQKRINGQAMGGKGQLKAQAAGKAKPGKQLVQNQQKQRTAAKAGTSAAKNAKAMPAQQGNGKKIVASAVQKTAAQGASKPLKNTAPAGKAKPLQKAGNGKKH